MTPLNPCSHCGQARCNEPCLACDSAHADCQKPFDDTREFTTGATRGNDDQKLDYEGFLSPKVLEAFAEYMHTCRLRNIPDGQTIRSSDNWQKGIPLDAYMKSMIRHVIDVWKMHREVLPPIGIASQKEALCAVLFNVQGYLFELLKAQDNDRRNGTTTVSWSGIGTSPSDLPGLSEEQGFEPPFSAMPTMS